MKRPDYDKIMQSEAARLTEKCGRKPRLLLHSCCAPCSSACLERLKDCFEITVFYYNPNIGGEEYLKRKAEQLRLLKDCFEITVFYYNPNIGGEEYLKRKAEQLRLLKETGWADILDCDHEAEKFAKACAGLEDAPEGGARCIKCFELRIGRTAEEAERGGFDCFTTTLTVSPLKNASAINLIGERAAAGKNAVWLHSDFKKRGGYLRSCELAREHGLYRQDYCGCEFSKRERDRRKAETETKQDYSK